MHACRVRWDPDPDPADPPLKSGAVSVPAPDANTELGKLIDGAPRWSSPVNG